LAQTEIWGHAANYLLDMLVKKLVLVEKTMEEVLVAIQNKPIWVNSHRGEAHAKCCKK
jgi:hypothetical protein